jgi:inosine kinase
MNELSADLIPTQVIENACALLISGYVLRDEDWPISRATLKACEIAKKAKVPIVLTLGTSSLVAARRDFFLQFIKDFVNVVAMNNDEAFELTGIQDPLLSLDATLKMTDLVLLTVGAQGLYVGAHVDHAQARKTSHELHTKSIINYNQFEFSRGRGRQRGLGRIRRAGFVRRQYADV